MQYTPAGLAWASEWGTLRYTMNAALIAEVWSQHIASKPYSSAPLHDSPCIMTDALALSQHLRLCQKVITVCIMLKDGFYACQDRLLGCSLRREFLVT